MSTKSSQGEVKFQGPVMFVLFVPLTVLVIIVVLCGVLIWTRDQKSVKASPRYDEEATVKAKLHSNDMKPPEVPGTPVYELPIPSPGEMDGTAIYEMSELVKYELPGGSKIVSNEDDTIGYSMGITG